MFETMKSFFAFFFPTLAAILIGIIFEEKLIRLEETIKRFAIALWVGTKQTIRDRRLAHDNPYHA